MALKSYLVETEKQYHLRLKTIVPIDDAIMDKIEASIVKYNPMAVSSPKRTILQRTPLDFPNTTAAEVYIVDMTFGLPAAPHVLRADLRKVLNAPEASVFVRNRNEPGEVETERLNALADIELEAARRKLTPASVLLDPEYSEGMHDNSDMYGTDYNDALLSYLGTVEKERHAAVVHAESAPFKWLPIPDRDNFNKEIKDAPFVTWKTKSKPDVSQHMLGNLDLMRGEVRRAYVDENGKRVVLSRKLGDNE